MLTAAGDDPGPAGKMFFAYKRVCARKPAFSSKAVAELADLLGLGWDDRLTAGVDLADDALQSGRPAPIAAANLVSTIYAARPDAELLAWALADMLIAALLKWDFAVPLLMGERYGPALKTLGGRAACARASRPLPMPSASPWSREQARPCAPPARLRAVPRRYSLPHQKSGPRAQMRSSKNCSARMPSRRRRPSALSHAGRRAGGQAQQD
ncbi:protein of unknown function (plasmid) [Shinella sp. WSC3-e]|nr:hypothetical protein SHINE37_110262 [Rhizobiaceae bacterium]CAK7260710.1 protein of unknown function [Shinella sp. WSC3-e]